jgi:hypothetical protein
MAVTREHEVTDARQKRMVNIRLSPALWARAKAAAGEQGVTLERWVTAALEAQLLRSRAPLAQPPAHLESVSLSWRVMALEGAVDYLASAIGVGLPSGAGAEGSVAVTSAPRSPAMAPAGGEDTPDEAIDE